MNTKEILREMTPPFLWKASRALRKAVAATAPESAQWTYGAEQPAAFYDQRFAERSGWKEHYSQSHYYPLWTVVVDRLMAAGAQRVVDVGCGPGQFACLLRDRGVTGYLGLDFSELRLAHARELCPGLRFEQADIFQSDILKSEDYDAVVLLEFLEHVERDLEVLRMVRPGALVLGTVPNFSDVGHVRCFRTASEVQARYAMLDGIRVDALLMKPTGQTIFLIEGRRRQEADR